MSEQEILRDLDDLNRLVKVHPRSEQLPQVEEVKKFNQHLRRLTLWLEPNSGVMDRLAEPTRQRIRSALATLEELLQKKVESNHPPADRIPILTDYLEGLLDLADVAPKLTDIQRQFWQLQRANVMWELASILKRRKDADSPLTTLGEVESKLKSLLVEVNRCKVFDPEGARPKLKEELQNVVTYCENLKRKMTYQAKFRVKPFLQNAPQPIEIAHRALTVQSPGKSQDFGLVPSQIDDLQIQFKTKQKDYPITLGLGTPITIVLSIYDNGEDKWITLEQFDLTTEPGPLAPLGLPLIRHDQEKITKLLRLQKLKLEMKLEFSDFRPLVPKLLWDAVSHQE